MESFLAEASSLAWGMPLLILLMGGGLFLMFYCRFVPFRHLGHSIEILSGKYVDPNAPGQISPFQAMSSALASTIGMGNISGVAVGIAMGGPGVLFWMWVSAFVGMATKFFTCTLSVMYRGRNERGEVEGGPMYMVTEGLGPKWKPLSILFAAAGLIGTLPLFQSNQLTQIVRDVVLVPSGLIGQETFLPNLFMGLGLAFPVSIIMFGGLKRIAGVATKLVPLMVVLYTGSVLYIIGVNISAVPSMFRLIFTDAFSADAVLGGAVMQIIIMGARRASFSNEAGIGTAAMMHGESQTTEPVREGLVAMLEPFIDTIIVCTMTGLAILVTGVWETNSGNGVSMTAQAFGEAMPTVGKYLLVVCVFIFAFTSLFSYCYYGSKCFTYLFGFKYRRLYDYFYIATIIIGAVVTITSIINLIDTAFALMAIPTMTCAIFLSPKVMAAARDYFGRMKAERA
ncbi:alanine/glycine:cation symporter family protein [Rufibacter psychrotolerans]|uniref:alanine/glycine:cation symporter family protein n=1 Tax=Rufibacter psychrotolerans TaxID=2812556 RepID=UPI0035B52FDF